jgi:hypothetical protein
MLLFLQIAIRKMSNRNPSTPPRKMIHTQYYEIHINTIKPFAIITFKVLIQVGTLKNPLPFIEKPLQ